MAWHACRHANSRTTGRTSMQEETGSSEAPSMDGSNGKPFGRTISKFLQRKQQANVYGAEPAPSCQHATEQSPVRLRRSSRLSSKQQQEADPVRKPTASQGKKRYCRDPAEREDATASAGYFGLLPSEVRPLFDSPSWA
jgi:hypothetical protein